MLGTFLAMYPAGEDGVLASANVSTRAAHVFWVGAALASSTLSSSNASTT